MGYGGEAVGVFPYRLVSPSCALGFERRSGGIEASPAGASQYTPSEIAKQLHNPLSNLREVIFQLDVLPNVGPNDKTDWATTIQPVWPFPLVADWKLVTYSIIPVVSQPGLAPGADRTNGLGDSTFFGYLVPPNEGPDHLGLRTGSAGPHAHER